MSRRHVHRFFVADRLGAGAEAVLVERDRRHAERVLRLRPGAPVEVADDAGAVFRAELLAGGRLRVGERLAAEDAGTDGLTVWLALAGGRADLAVEKLTELGVAAVGALAAERSKGEPRLDRWERVAEAAARQSKRARLPRVLGPLSFAEAVRQPGAVVLDHEAADARPFAPSARALLVGPEPGWSDAERDLARAAGVPLALLPGGVVLRSETAALAATALVVFAGATLRG